MMPPLDVGATFPVNVPETLVAITEKLLSNKWETYQKD
jgi:hypothetical protein